MTAHFSILAWKIPWTMEPGGLVSIRSISSWFLSHFTSIWKYTSSWWLSQISTFWEPNKHMTFQMVWEDPSVVTEHLLCFLWLGAFCCSRFLFEAFLLTYASPTLLFLLQDCPPEAGDFRAQQCSAHNDVKYHGQFYEWLPVSNDPDNPCSLKCQAKGTALVVELAPKVLDGTRCYTESLDMCISGLCQVSASFFAFYFSGGIYVNSFCVVLLSE